MSPCTKWCVTRSPFSTGAPCSSPAEAIWNALGAVMPQQDYQAIRTAIDALNQGTMRLAELMMDSAVGAALKGKTMDSADVGEGPAAPHPIAQAEIKN